MKIKAYQTETPAFEVEGILTSKKTDKDINFKWSFAENDLDGEITYQNPVSGSYGTLQQAFSGWSEQDDTENEKWAEFSQDIYNFEIDFADFIDYENNIITDCIVVIEID